MVFPVVDATFEQILDSNTLDTVHCVCFARACLAICENSYDSLIENQVKDWAHLVEIELLVSLKFTKSIIKFEFRVFDSLGYTIYFIFAIMNIDLGIDD